MTFHVDLVSFRHYSQMSPQMVVTIRAIEMAKKNQSNMVTGTQGGAVRFCSLLHFNYISLF